MKVRECSFHTQAGELSWALEAGGPPCVFDVPSGGRVRAATTGYIRRFPETQSSPPERVELHLFCVADDETRIEYVIAGQAKR